VDNSQTRLENSERHPEFSRRSGGLCAVPDLFVQAGGREGRLDAQLAGQQAAAEAVLRQGLAAPTGAGQQAHGLQVRFLQPGVELQLTPDAAQRLLDIPCFLVDGGQSDQRLQQQAVQPLTLDYRPFLESNPIGQRQVLQEGAAVEGDCLLDSSQIG